MYILTVTLIVLILLSYNLFNKDIFSPSVLTFLGYFISAIFAIYNQLYWDIDVSDELIAIMVIGWLGFFIGELFIRQVLYRGKNVGGSLTENTLSYIDVDTLLLVFFLILNLGITALLWNEISAVSTNGTEGVVSAYKNSDEQLSTFMQQITKVTAGSAYVFLFIFANNYMESKSSRTLFPKKNYMLLIPGVLYMTQKIMLGGRYTAIAFIIAAIFCFYFLHQYLDNWKHSIPFKYLVRILFLVVLIVVVFWAIKNFIGRSSEAGILEYISRYIGGSYELFDIYLSDLPSKAYETFGYLITSFNKLGLTDIPVRTTHEFRFSDSGILIGNVYTGLRNYYNDFGMIGVFLMSMLKSMIFTGMYCKIRSQQIHRNMFLIIFYMYEIYTCVFEFFVEYFFARFSLGFFIEIIIMYLIYYITCKKRIHFTLGGTSSVATNYVYQDNSGMQSGEQ